MSTVLKTTAARRYATRLLIAMAFYAVALSFALYFAQRHHPAGLLAYGLALLPALPILGVIAIAGMYIAEIKDEFERMVLVQSMLWALGLTMATLTVWGFLEIFAGVPHFQPYLAFPLFWVFVAIASPFVKMRYR